MRANTIAPLVAPGYRHDVVGRNRCQDEACRCASRKLR
jgi:hypothetical protein